MKETRFSTLEEHIAHVTLAYYRQAEELRPAPQEFGEWVATLPASQQPLLARLGYASGQLLPGFRRYLLEKRGQRLVAYLEQHLPKEAWQLWRRQGNPLEPDC